ILVQTVGHYGTRQRTRTDPARGDCSEDLAGRPRHRRGLQPHQPGPQGPRRRPPRGEREVSRRRRIEFDAGDGGFGAALGELLAYQRAVRAGDWLAASMHAAPAERLPREVDDETIAAASVRVSRGVVADSIGVPHGTVTLRVRRYCR